MHHCTCIYVPMFCFVFMFLLSAANYSENKYEYVLSADWVPDEYYVILPIFESGIAAGRIDPERFSNETLEMVTSSSCEPFSFTTVAAISKDRGFVRITTLAHKIM